MRSGGADVSVVMRPLAGAAGGRMESPSLSRLQSMTTRKQEAAFRCHQRPIRSERCCSHSATLTAASA